MNRLVIKDGNIIENNTNLVINNNILSLNEDISLFLESNSDLKIIVNEGINVNITRVVQDKTIATLEIYLNQNSNLTFNSLNIHDLCEENINIYLEGENSNISFNLAPIVKDFFKHKYEINVYHKERRATSNLIIHGITLKEAVIEARINSHILKGKKGATAHQETKILTFDEKPKSIVEPRIYIYENEVLASHSAAIGRIDEDVMFYLTSRGISEKDATNLLINAHILGIFNINEKIKKVFQEKINLTLSR